MRTPREDSVSKTNKSCPGSASSSDKITASNNGNQTTSQSKRANSEGGTSLETVYCRVGNVETGGEGNIASTGTTTAPGDPLYKKTATRAHKNQMHDLNDEVDSGDDGNDSDCEDSDDSYVEEEYGVDETFTSGPQKSTQCSSSSSDPVVNNEQTTKSHQSKRNYIFKKRRSNPRLTSKMRDRWNSRINTIESRDLASMTCCTKLKCFEACDKDFLLQKIKSIMSMSYTMRRQTLSSMLGSSGCFYFDGKKVCSTFLYKAFHISRDVQSSVRAIFNRGSISDGVVENDSRETGNTTTTMDASVFNPSLATGLDAILPAPGREAIISFLLRLADETGDKMPDSSERHLPFHKMYEVYSQFQEDYKRTTSASLESLPSLNYFLKIWKLECRHIKVRKANRFTKCDICERLREETIRVVTNFESTATIRAQKRAHYQMISDERLEYKRKRDIATLHPSEAWSLIVDGADQKAYGLPHFITSTKSQRGEALKVKLIGLLEHGLENKLRLLTMTEEHKTGANHVIEAVHRFLMDRSISDTPPPKLFIQVDNCTRENKNRYFLSYIECLLMWNVFKEIEVSFLPIGHTHEDIDQAFSTTSAKLSTNNAITLRDLHKELGTVYNRHTVVCHMRHVINWSDLCEQEQVLTNVKNFTTYRYFKFKSHVNSDCNISVELTVRANVYDEWKQLRPSFIKQLPDLSKTPPTDIIDNESKWEAQKVKVTSRLESEEFRILDPSKIGELRELRDSVFRSRRERFHWNLANIIELKQQHKDNYISDNCLAGHHASSSARENTILQPEGRTNTIEPPNQEIIEGYNYDVGSFVAVLSETSDRRSSFWIGKVTQAKTLQNGVVQKLTAHWYEPYAKRGEQVDKYVSKYAPAYLEKGTTKERPWKSLIETSSILVNFQGLLHNRRLPSAVQKHLRTAVPSVFET